MKINRLCTLSQFIELLNKEYKDSFELVLRYSNFLKQPLTKEMFDNDSEIPMVPGEFVMWVEAEKKVIFEGVILTEDNVLELPYSDGFCPYIEIENTTIHDLAEATKGQLKLKNVEI